ncbi:MAG: SecD/SecF family protein translocase subunit [Clostridium sp.]|nr:SecD/SecF family protein translocase subunit [Clostridium sp.]MCM1546760.1 SecD/SecF family protein translocase subunit [Ruminococcus sp.]
MKNAKKPVFFIVFGLIIAFAVSVVFGFSTQYGDIETVRIKGVDDIRLGIDIQGGVDVTFVPAGGVDASDEQLDSALEVVKLRLASLNINDSEVYQDSENDRIIVRFPWQAGEKDFDPEAAVKELGETAMLTFRVGTETNEDGSPAGDVVLQGTEIQKAEPLRQPQEDGTYSYVVSLKLTDDAAEKFGAVTSAMAGTGEAISIWMDNEMVSAPTVNEAITDGSAVITGSSSDPFTADSAKSLADKINSGALPFKLETASFKTISPTLGTNALKAMIISGLIAFVFIAIYMTCLYKVTGAVAAISIIGQVSVTLACISGWFGFMESSTLTIPGIAGIILTVGMGVDANIITGERIREEINSGKSLDSALRAGYKRAFSSILDGNLTSLIVAVILMGAFGTPDFFLTAGFNKILSLFGIGATTEGVIYSFGYTLLVGTLMNFVMGVLASRLMVYSISRFKLFRNKKLYGGVSNE